MTHQRAERASRKLERLLKARAIDDHQTLDDIGSGDRQPGRDVPADRVTDQHGASRAQRLNGLLHHLSELYLARRLRPGRRITMCRPVDRDAAETGREEIAELVVVVAVMPTAREEHDGIAVSLRVVGDLSEGCGEIGHAGTVTHMTDRSVTFLGLLAPHRLPWMTDEAQLSGAAQTRASLLDAGAALAEEYGLAGMSVNMVVARAGVAKGTFYVHFKDRAAFIDALHARFHEGVEAAAENAVAGLPPGAERLYKALAAYLDVSLEHRGAKALSLETRSDPTGQSSMSARRERLIEAALPDLKAMGWDEPEAAAQLVAAMTREISALEFDAGRPLPASRRALKRFLEL